MVAIVLLLKSVQYGGDIIIFPVQLCSLHPSHPPANCVLAEHRIQFGLKFRNNFLQMRMGQENKIHTVEYHHNISALEDCLALTVQVFFNLILSLNEYVGVTKRSNVNLRKKNMPVTVRADARVWYHRWYVCAWFRGPIQCMQNLTSSIAKSDIYHSKIWHLPLQNLTSTIAKLDICHGKIWHLPLQNLTSTIAKSDIYHCKIKIIFANLINDKIYKRRSDTPKILECGAASILKMQIFVESWN